MEIDLSLTLAENLANLVQEAIDEDPELGEILRDAIDVLPNAFDEPTRRKARNEFYRVVNERLNLMVESDEQDT